MLEQYEITFSTRQWVEEKDIISATSEQDARAHFRNIAELEAVENPEGWEDWQILGITLYRSKRHEGR